MLCHSKGGPQNRSTSIFPELDRNAEFLNSALPNQTLHFNKVLTCFIHTLQLENHCSKPKHNSHLRQITEYEKAYGGNTWEKESTAYRTKEIEISYRRLGVCF